MTRLINNLLDKVPYIANLKKQVENQELFIADLKKQVENQGLFSAGHYYSPIPNHEDVIEFLESPKQYYPELSDINLNKEKQLKILKKYQEFYTDLPFPEQQNDNCRYYYDQIWFSYADAIFLYSFLRQYQPRRIIEVGSGFSSAVMLDTVERFFHQETKFTFIEPYPERLKSLLKPKEKKNIQIVENKVQDIPFEVFTSLRSGDLLFIDSTHVVKFGSDLQYLMFEIIPKLSHGVFVHFHDVFFPFEYPAGWLAEGRYWNEDYFLRAFLSYNSQWQILFFNTYVAHMYKDFLEEKMPLCLKNTGGSIYIQKTR